MTAEQITSILAGASGLTSAVGAAAALVIHAVRAKYGPNDPGAPNGS